MASNNFQSPCPTLDPYTPADWIRFGQMTASQSVIAVSSTSNTLTPSQPTTTQASDTSTPVPNHRRKTSECASSQSQSTRSQNSWNTLPESGQTDVDVVVKWLTTLGHYDMWRTGKPSKKSIGEMVAKHLVDLNHPKRGGEQCKKKIASIETKFKEASALRNSTGQGVLDPEDAAEELAELGIDTGDDMVNKGAPLATEDKMLKICPWYWQLEPVLGERPFVKPLYVRETNGTPSQSLSDLLQLTSLGSSSGDFDGKSDDLDPALVGDPRSDGSDHGGGFPESSSGLIGTPLEPKKRKTSPSPGSSKSASSWPKKGRPSPGSLPLGQMMSDFLPLKEERIMKEERMKEAETSQHALSEKLVDAIGKLGANCADELKLQRSKAKADLLTSLLSHGKTIEVAREVVKETFGTD